ncbi:hypothetical protein CN354_12855 [Bacillus cereus]|nr:hypothetical protein CN354_12855 [Bacillus cereus]
MHRSGQGLFLPHVKLKQREKTCRSPFVLHSSDLYAGKSNGIYTDKDTNRTLSFYIYYSCIR